MELQISNAIEAALMQGNLAKLSEQERLSYFQNLCTSLGLNSLTKPFEYITLNGKLVLYANKGCTEQLRHLHKVSVKVVSRETIEGVYVITAEAYLPNGRFDSSTGAVTIGGLKGEALANAFMKCETKAKRRVTLSLLGLNMLDESEVADIDPKNITPSQNAPQQLVAPTKPVDVTPTTDTKAHVSAPKKAVVASVTVEPPDADPFAIVVTEGAHRGKKLADLPDELLIAAINKNHKYKAACETIMETRMK